MKIRLTFTIGDYRRKAMAHHSGDGTYRSCKELIEALVEADLETIESDYSHHVETQKVEP